MSDLYTITREKGGVIAWTDEQVAYIINKYLNENYTLKQLANPEVQNKFETIILDTIDLLYDFCEKYICDNAVRADGTFGVDSIGDIPYGR